MSAMQDLPTIPISEMRRTQRLEAMRVIAEELRRVVENAEGGSVQVSEAMDRVARSLEWPRSEVLYGLQYGQDKNLLRVNRETGDLETAGPAAATVTAASQATR